MYGKSAYDIIEFNDLNQLKKTTLVYILFLYKNKLPNLYTNAIIKFYYIIFTFPVPNCFFSPLLSLFSHLFAKILFSLSSPTDNFLFF